MHPADRSAATATRPKKLSWVKRLMANANANANASVNTNSGTNANPAQTITHSTVNRNRNGNKINGTAKNDAYPSSAGPTSGKVSSESERDHNYSAMTPDVNATEEALGRLDRTSRELSQITIDASTHRIRTASLASSSASTPSSSPSMKHSSKKSIERVINISGEESSIETSTHQSSKFERSHYNYDGMVKIPRGDPTARLFQINDLTSIENDEMVSYISSNASLKFQENHQRQFYTKNVNGNLNEPSDVATTSSVKSLYSGNYAYTTAPSIAITPTQGTPAVNRQLSSSPASLSTSIAASAKNRLHFSHLKHNNHNNMLSQICTPAQSIEETQCAASYHSSVNNYNPSMQACYDTTSAFSGSTYEDNSSTRPLISASSSEDEDEDEGENGEEYEIRTNGDGDGDGNGDVVVDARDEKGDDDNIDISTDSEDGHLKDNTHVEERNSTDDLEMMYYDTVELTNSATALAEGTDDADREDRGTESYEHEREHEHDTSDSRLQVGTTENGDASASSSTSPELQQPRPVPCIICSVSGESVPHVHDHFHDNGRSYGSTSIRSAVTGKTSISGMASPVLSAINSVSTCATTTSNFTGFTAHTTHTTHTTHTAHTNGATAASVMTLASSSRRIARL